MVEPRFRVSDEGEVKVGDGVKFGMTGTSAIGGRGTTTSMGLFDWDKEEYEWRERGLCLGQEELFFPRRGESSVAAKMMCFSCPSRLPCLEHAIEWGEPSGVWGGYGEEDRRRLRRKVEMSKLSVREADQRLLDSMTIKQRVRKGMVALRSAQEETLPR